MTRTRYLLSASGLFFAAACLFPALLLRSGQTVPGIVLLVTGWFGVSVRQYGWFANICALFAVLQLLKGQVKTARVASILALLIACDSFRMQGILYPNVATYAPIQGWGVGIYLWCVSLFLIAIATVVSPQPTDKT